MESITAYIVDDEKHAAETLQWELGRACSEVQVTQVFNDARIALEHIQNTPPDLLFLDVEMPRISGLELLSALDSVQFGVIFTTAYDKFALKAIKHRAVDYILKPVDGGELRTAVDKFQENRRSLDTDQLQQVLDKLVNKETNGKVALPASNGLLFVRPDRIMYCKSDSNYTDVHFTDGNHHVISKTLKEIEELLGGGSFVRVHNSYLVNMMHVEQFVKSDGGYLVMDDGSHVSVSRSRREELIRKFT